jgi:hypothetical protein
MGNILEKMNEKIPEKKFFLRLGSGLWEGKHGNNQCQIVDRGVQVYRPMYSYHFVPECDVINNTDLAATSLE